MAIVEPASSTDESTIWSGVLHAFVAFDWGEEVDLDAAQRTLPAELHLLPRRPRTPPSIAYQSPPLRFELPAIALDMPVVGRVEAPAEFMLFDFGAGGLAARVAFALSAADLTRFAGELTEPVELLRGARAALGPVFGALRDAIVGPDWSELSEEYFVFQLFPQAHLSPGLLRTREAAWLAGLVRLEAAPLSDSEIAEALRLWLSYGRDDLTICDWAAAVVVDRDCAEILETMAFANLQLLEFRHIEKRLDARLAAAYGLIRQLARSRLPIWRLHSKSLRDLGQLKAEINEMFERASDALTLVGDPFVARLFQQLAVRFHLEQWSRNIRRSIQVLESIYQSASDQAAVYRTEALELSIVLLIVAEIVLSLVRH